MKTISKEIVKSILVRFFFLIISVAVLISTYYIIDKNVFSLKKFDERIMSAATMRGVDINKTIKIYITGILISAFFLFVSFGNIMSCAVANLESICINAIIWIHKMLDAIRLKDLMRNRAIKLIIVFVSLATGLYLICTTLNLFFLVLIIFFEIFIFNVLLFPQKVSTNISIKDFIFWFSLNHSLLSIATHFIRLESVYFIYKYIVFLCAMVCFLLSRHKPSRYSLMTSLPLIYWLLTELTYNYMLKIEVLIAIKIIFLVLSVIFSFYHSSNDFHRVGWDLHNFMFVLSVVSIVNTYNYHIEYNPDYFESANHTVSLFSLFKYGEIPIFDTFDAHMLKNQLDGFLYWVLGGKVDEVVLAPYVGLCSSIIGAVGTYLIFRIFISENTALLLVLFLPSFYSGLDFVPFVLASSYKLMLIENVQNESDSLKINYKISINNFKYYAVYCVILVCSVLYSLDICMVSIVSSVSILVLFYVITRNKIGLKRFIVSLSITLLLCITVTLIICYFRDIQFENWLIHFWKITIASNQNWAYGSLSTSDLSTLKHYFLLTVPILSVLIFWINRLLKKKYDDKVISMILVIIGFGAAWMSNIPRTIVRHNLLEKSSFELLGPAYLFLILSFLFYFVGKYNKNVVNYLVAFLLAVCPYGDSLTHRIQFKFSDNINDSYSSVSERYNRIQFDTDNADGLKIIMDTLLNSEETFFDFSNNTLMYTLTERNNPIYENQSPGLISGETVQLMTIDTLERNKDFVVCAIMSRQDQIPSGLNALDGILNEDRYYLISEYLYNNYTPLVRYDDFDIWISKDKLLEKSNQIKTLFSISNTKKLSVEESVIGKKHYQGEIPYLWANCDDVKPDERDCIEKLQLDNGCYSVDISGARDDLNGNYLMIEIDSECSKEASMNFNYDGLEDTFYFNVHEGKHFYMFRISCDYKWYISSVGKIIIEDHSFDALSLYIINGETLNAYSA